MTTFVSSFFFKCFFLKNIFARSFFEVYFTISSLIEETRRNFSTTASENCSITVNWWQRIVHFKVHQKNIVNECVLLVKFYRCVCIYLNASVCILLVVYCLAIVFDGFFIVCIRRFFAFCSRTLDVTELADRLLWSRSIRQGSSSSQLAVYAFFV